MSVLNYPQLPPTVPQHIKRRLTSAEILALQATPITLVPAPGAGKMIVPVFAFVKYFGQGETAYNVAGGGNLNLLLGTNDPFGTQMTTNENILTQTSDNTASFNMQPVFALGDFVPSADMENLPLKIANVGAGEYITGTGEADVTVHYLEIDLTA